MAFMSLKTTGSIVKYTGMLMGQYIRNYGMTFDQAFEKAYNGFPEAFDRENLKMFPKKGKDSLADHCARYLRKYEGLDVTYSGVGVEKPKRQRAPFDWKKIDSDVLEKIKRVSKDEGRTIEETIELALQLFLTK